MWHVIIGTIADNLNYGPSLKGEKLSSAKLTELLKWADLDSSFLSKPITGLSVGQAQRVALARTLANDPEVYFYFFFNERFDVCAHCKQERSKRSCTHVVHTHALTCTMSGFYTVPKKVGNITMVTEPKVHGFESNHCSTPTNMFWFSSVF